MSVDVKIFFKKGGIWCSTANPSQITLIPFLTNVIKWMFCMQKCLLIKSTQVHCTDLSFWRHANKLWWSDKTWAGHQKVAGLNTIRDITITPLSMGHAVKDCLCSKCTCRDIYHLCLPCYTHCFEMQWKSTLHTIYIWFVYKYTHQNNLCGQWLWPLFFPTCN